MGSVREPSGIQTSLGVCRLISHADQHKPNVILIEDAGFGTALIGTLKRKNLPVIAAQPEGDKKTRLLREIAKFTNGQVFLLKTAPGRADLETELFSVRPESS